MRCFVAIDMPDEAREEIRKIQGSIANLPEANMNLVDPMNLHLTLEFLGELTDIQAGKCKEALKNIKFKKFNAMLGNAGVFPSESFIKVAWIGIEPKETIKELHEKVHNSLKEIAGLDSRFEPHITLARIKFVKDRQKFIERFKSHKIKPIKFPVDCFTLKKSTLKEAVIYEDIMKFPLS